MERLDQRQGFLVSATVHVMLITLLSSRDALKPSPAPQEGPPEARRTARVVIPPPEVLRQLLPPPVRPSQPARPAPTPPPREPDAKDRISIGPPSSERASTLRSGW